jgi:hypothetical protein
LRIEISLSIGTPNQNARERALIANLKSLNKKFAASQLHYKIVTFTMASAPPVVVSPDTELQFVLSESEATPKCSMTISHPGGGVTEHIAFKVRRLKLVRYGSNVFHAEYRRNCTARSKTKTFS